MQIAGGMHRRTGKYHLPYYHSQLNWYLILAPLVSTLYSPLLRTLYYSFVSPLVVMVHIMVNGRYPFPPPTYNFAFPPVLSFFYCMYNHYPSYVLHDTPRATLSRTIHVRVQLEQLLSSPAKRRVFPTTYYSYKERNKGWLVTPYT